MATDPPANEDALITDDYKKVLKTLESTMKQRIVRGTSLDILYKSRNARLCTNPKLGTVLKYAERMYQYALGKFRHAPLRTQRRCLALAARTAEVPGGHILAAHLAAIRPC